jgi:Ca-activated chloride channel family protein
MRTMKLVGLGLFAMGMGCSTGGEGGTSDTPGGSVNVSQGGAQDISQFRALIEQGLVPTPDTLDPVGFFAEHAVDLPKADCGEDVCVHPYLAVAPRFNGSNWTMAFVAMNTAVDPSKLDRPPVHLTVALDQSGFADVDVASLSAGIEGLAASLRPEDRVSIVSFAKVAARKVLLAEPGSAELQEALDSLGDSVWNTNEVALYDGIAEAANAFDEGDAAGFVGVHRVLLITSGRATRGITDPAHILALGEGLVKEGTAFGVIGVGHSFDAKIPSALGSMGAGTYAYALDGFDLSDLLAEEGKTTLFPLASDFVLKVLPSKGYKVGRIYGTKRATASVSGATLSMPALFIGQRDGASDVGGSRRGGGGGLFVELIADKAAAAGVSTDAPAFQVTADWKAPDSGAARNIDSTVLNTLLPGQNPDGMWWTISDGSSGKPFMMLNMYLALRGSLDFYQAGDCERALGVIDMMKPAINGWLGMYSDTDITDDNNLMLSLAVNIQNACGQATSGPVTPTAPEDFDGGCCFL